MTEDRDRQFDDLVRDNLKDAYRLALRLSGDRHAAEDVAQEAFRRATGAWDRFEGRSTFRTWLFRIVVNVYRSRARTNGSKPRELFDLPDKAERGPVGCAESREFQEHVGRLIGTLPDRQREVLVLHLFQQCDHAEIAGILGVSEQNVRTNLHLARRRMQTLLQPYLEDD